MHDHQNIHRSTQNLKYHKSRKHSAPGFIFDKSLLK